MAEKEKKNSRSGGRPRRTQTPGKEAAQQETPKIGKISGPRAPAERPGGKQEVSRSEERRVGKEC